MDHVYRQIRPSFGENSNSTTDPRTTPETSSSDPPRPGGSEKETDSSSGKRRRVPESVTRNACLNCKKARAKCDGKTPCKRCASRTEASECIYEIHVKHAKEELVKQLRHYKAKDHLATQLFHALCNDDKVPDILERLKSNESYEEIVEWLGRPALNEDEVTSPRESQSSDHDIRDANPDGLNWSSVTSNSIVLDHLFQLYFAWTHPVHTLFSEGHFVDSYLGRSEGCCSSVLVNAICAMGCQLYSRDGERYNVAQLADDFCDAVNANLNPDNNEVTTIQAFAVMFLVYVARGNSLRASAYLKVAVSKIARYSGQDHQGVQEVWKNTVRGVRNLNIEWSQMSFQGSATIDVPVFDSTDLNEKSLDKAPWHHYRFISEKCPARLSLLATTNREKTKLLTIIQDSTNLMYASGMGITAQQVLRLYGRFVQWRNDLPGSISNLKSTGSHKLPHVLSLLILYTNSVVQLLRPLLSFEGFPAFHVEGVVWKHAQEGLTMLDDAYKAQFTCSYQQVLQMFSILHLTDVVARYFPGGIDGSKDGPDAIQFALGALEESMASSSIAKILRGMVQRTSIECKIRLPDKAGGLDFRPIPSDKTLRMDDLIDACTRPSYVQPVEQVCNSYLSSFTTEWVANSAAFGFATSSSGRRESRDPSSDDTNTQSLMQIRNLLNG